MRTKWNKIICLYVAALLVLFTAINIEADETEAMVDSVSFSMRDYQDAFSDENACASETQISSILRVPNTPSGIFVVRKNGEKNGRYVYSFLQEKLSQNNFTVLLWRLSVDIIPEQYSKTFILRYIHSKDGKK